MAYFVHPTSVVDAGTTIGEGTKIRHFCHIQSGAVIGKNCILGENVTIGPNVVIGDNVTLQDNVSVEEGVIFEDGVSCGTSCVFTKLPCSQNSVSSRKAQTVVHKNATIGANTTILCGLEIGKGAVVAEDSIVTRTVQDHCMVVGAPARERAWVCQCGAKLESGVCPRCNRVYHRFAQGMEEQNSAVNQ